jgi:hypothetical protein
VTVAEQATTQLIKVGISSRYAVIVYIITQMMRRKKMTKEELEKATGQELIEQRDYCGVDGYYGDYLDDVNAEMFKRFNRLAELEKENAELREKVERYYCLLEKSMDCETCKYCDLSDDRKKEPCKSCFFDSSKWELKE